MTLALLSAPAPCWSESSCWPNRTLAYWNRKRTSLICIATRFFLSMLMATRPRPWPGWRNGALPCAAWLADPEARRIKIQNLYQVVRLAQELDLPLNVGTEMNSFGQKLVDDFDAPELAPVRQAFLDGAHFVYGHTVMQRVLGLGYQSEWAQSHLPSRREQNDFYTSVGYRVLPGKAAMAQLAAWRRDVDTLTYSPRFIDLPGEEHHTTRVETLSEQVSYAIEAGEKHHRASNLSERYCLAPCGKLPGQVGR